MAHPGRKIEDCRDCAKFDDDPASLERRLVGLTILGSAYGSVRGAAGICEVLQRFMEPLEAAGCPHFRPCPPPGQDGGRGRG